MWTWYQGLSYLVVNFLTKKIPNVTSKFLSHVRTRLLNMTWSNLRFNVWRSLVTMATNLPSCFSIQFLEQLLKFLANFTLLKYVKSQRRYGLLITKELIFGFQILDLKDHFSASLIVRMISNIGVHFLIACNKYRTISRPSEHPADE